MSDALAAFGTFLKIGDGAGTEVFTTIAEVRDIKGPNITLNTADVTNHDSQGWKEIIGTIIDAGEVTFGINFQPTEATHDDSTGLLSDLLGRVKRNFQLVFPDTTTWTFTALVTNFNPDEPVQNELTADVTLELTGSLGFA
ncbi:MAG: phage tail tube protein [Chloroflexota bacterium]